MLTVSRPQTTHRQAALGRAVTELVGGLLVAALLPFFLRILIEPVTASVPSQWNSGIGTVFAILLGQFALRSLSRYPGTRAAYYVLPTFTVAYGIVLLFFFLFRLDYSRVQFVASFLLCIGWYLWSTTWRGSQGVLRVGVVPVGDVRGLTQLPGVAWRILRAPDAPLSDIDAVVADLRADVPDAWERQLAEIALSGIPVYHHKQIRESLTGQVELEHLSENNFGSLIPQFSYVTIKRVVDTAAALAVMVLLLPFLLPVAIAIRLDSPGPVFFRQPRMGYRGEPFVVTKFRTMRHGAAGTETDARASAMTRAEDDRVTRVGRFLRRSRIDELPQAWNVLRGEMSWIGPRPEALVLSRWYEGELPFYRYRHIVRPGITGWAQVNQGHVTDLDEVGAKLHYDFYYIRNFSLSLDALIALRTVVTMLTGRGHR